MWQVMSVKVCLHMAYYHTSTSHNLPYGELWYKIMHFYVLLTLLKRKNPKKKKKRKKRKIPLTLFMSSYATLVVIFGFGESHIERKAFLFMPYKG